MGRTRPGAASWGVALACAALVGCPAPSAAPTKAPTQAPRKAASPSPQAEASPIATPSASPGLPTVPTGTPTAAPTPASMASPAAKAFALTGKVKGLDGLPAAGITVVARVITNNGGGLLANNGSGLLANNGGAVLSNNGGTYRLTQAGTPGELRATTDAEGRFGFDAPADARLNVEAIRTEDEKALALGVASAGALELQLAPTGTLTGKLSAPELPTLTNFEGIDVFIPGTSYAAKAAADGAWRIGGVPVGSLPLVAGKTGVGRGEAATEVKPKQTTTVDLVLAPIAPAITGVSPARAMAGDTVRIAGARFGVSRGASVQVTLGGAVASGLKALDDGALSFVVPPTAVSGDLVVTSDGVASQPWRLTVVRPVTPNRGETVAGQGETTGGNNIDGPGTASTFNQPTAIAIAADGRVVVGDAGNDNLRGITREGAGWRVATVAGWPTPGATAKTTFGPMAFGPDGALYICSGRCLRKVTFDAPTQVSQAVVAGDPTVAGHAVGAGAQARFSELSGLAFDAAGDLWLTDAGNHAVYRVALKDAGQPVTLAAGRPEEAGFADGPAGDAQFDTPRGLAFGPGGVLYVMDTANDRLRKLVGQGAGAQVATAAGEADADAAKDGTGAEIRFYEAVGLVADTQGRLYTTEDTDENLRVITFDAAGVPTVMRVAGNAFGVDDPGAIPMTDPLALAVDGLGNPWLVDATVIRQIHRFTE